MDFATKSEVVMGCRRIGKTMMVLQYAEIWYWNYICGRIDDAGWPTRDAASPQEEC